MTHTLRRTGVTLLLAVFAASCATSQTSTKPAARTKAVPANATADKQRRELNEGYSLLYQDAGKFDMAELILYVKAETNDTNEIVTAVSDAGDHLKKELERIARDHPAVRIDLDPLPAMEKKKRAAIAKDRAKYFAPVVGHGGREYERTVLIGYANGLNHERHLCEVMAVAEPDANLKKFLLDTEKRYGDLYDRVTALLEKEYFK